MKLFYIMIAAIGHRKIYTSLLPYSACHIIICFILHLLFCHHAFSASFETPQPLLLDCHSLKELKQHVILKDPLFIKSLEKLLIKADACLDLQPESVMDKTSIPPSHDKHDYMSLGRYWWPDLHKSDGLPYIRRDGKINPEIWMDKYDYNRKCKMIETCKLLSMAYFCTDDEKYADCAVRHLKAWFLDPDTGMNPNLKYAQGIPGVSSGRPAGIIESYSFPVLFDSIRLLQESSAWTPTDQENLNTWIKEYLHWLLESPAGIKESHALNNHGSWYDFQVVYFALYTGQDALAKEWLATHTFARLKTQFTKDYIQPLELSRTKSFFYCVYNLKALFHCAHLGLCVGEDLWEAKLNDKATLRKALDWLLPFALGEKKWINDDVELVDSKLLAPLLLMAASAYHDQSYFELYNQIMKDDMLSEDLSLFYQAMFLKLQAIAE